MSVGEGDRGQLWVNGQLTVRLRGPGAEPGRILRIRRPFALIGQIPGADIRIDDPSVDGRHALLILDRRGVFGVDLLSRSGTRFAGAEAASAWLGTGDILEIAGRRVELLQLRIDGHPIDPPLSDDDPLGDAPGLVALTLEPLDVPGPPWMLGSALAFVGRGDACAIRIDHASASQTHCALLRGPSNAYVIDLLGRRTLINDRAVDGASALHHGDVLTVGQANFTVKLEASTAPSLDREPGRAVALDPRGAMVAMLAEAIESGRDASKVEVLDVLRQFQADTATLLEAQIGRIEAMNREIASLREELRGHLGPAPEPAEPLRLDLIPPPIVPSGEPASWLLDRLNALETESRSTWKDLLAKIVTPRSPAQPSQSLVSTRHRPE